MCLCMTIGRIKGLTTKGISFEYQGPHSKLSKTFQHEGDRVSPKVLLSAS